MSELEKWWRPFVIRATKDLYMGQGVGYDKGDEHQRVFTRPEAEHIAAILNCDSWNPNCWEVCEEQPPP